MGTREKTLEIIERLLMGPNPLKDYCQENGEEILFYDPPQTTYVTGILFPQIIDSGDLSQIEENDVPFSEPIQDENVTPQFLNHISSIEGIAEPALEAETSKINNYKQSAMGITVCVPTTAKNISVEVFAGSYSEHRGHAPKPVKTENGGFKIELSKTEQTCYYRKQNHAVLSINRLEMPSLEQRHKNYKLLDNGKLIEGLEITITFRLRKADSIIYTFTLINTKKAVKKNDKEARPKTDLHWFQCHFSVNTDVGFMPLPESYYAESTDSDYRLNSLLYRDVKTYGIGHGCAATWDDTTTPFPKSISASVMPEYEVKPIVPSSSDLTLSIKVYSSDSKATIDELTTLCNEYEKWINSQEERVNLLPSHFHATAKKQISLCKTCLSRLRNGVKVLSDNPIVMKAFQLANEAMLMQQLHYKLPVTKIRSFNKRTLLYELDERVVLPDINDPSTWYEPKKNVYGKWRPFQIAFLLMNLESMSNKDSAERKIIDLIWFPTGGGKTEAYLGLTAYSIFLRRIKNPADAGTAAIMRYTLRLLTAQQYERASSLICSMEMIRSRNLNLLGSARITVGLWAGENLTDNWTKDVIPRIRKIRNGSEKGNVSIVLKCPWCGTSMESIQFEKGSAFFTPGYSISKDGNHVVFKCANTECDFANDDFTLPLSLFDDEIYANPPTLLFGTVDKFAMLPFRPEAKSIFGGDQLFSPPDLIIQDELHLITGPLGSAVGLYETLIDELCKSNGASPKIVASTATISHASEQCNSLYACGEDKVFQFPVQGLDYKDCFFAFEDQKASGRKYVGLYGSASSSSASASIFTFAAELYAAKKVEVETDTDRDPYWTNLAYFGSMKELGQAATWYIADIKERLEVIYQNNLETMATSNRRYIYESGLEELTSRMNSEEIPRIIKKLEIPYSSDKGKGSPVDMCLATNMVAVGVDIQRLGLMTVTGQPKSISEYIQATSRVGRNKNAPGLVLVIYNTSKPRDKSCYEKFQSLHSKLYFSVEPTSVTPFSRPLRDRALHAIFVGLFRAMTAQANRYNARITPTDEEFEKIKRIILTRASKIDLSEIEDISKQLDSLRKEWEGWKMEKYASFVLGDDAPLLCQAGIIKPAKWEDRGWETPTSMRNVDRECGLSCSKNLII